METTNILIHKGEKEKKYHLYVEDYVMSYLKNYGVMDCKNISFYGKREPEEKKYYIYGAGQQKEISYFEKYTLLDEISCRYVMDMPVFSIKDDGGIYELAGYDIFYQSNEAMQSYMVEQRKLTEAEEKKQGRNGGQTGSRTQYRTEREIAFQAGMQNRKKVSAHKSVSERAGSRLMLIQLSAIFIILAAIVINSTNSYTKLTELNQAAVEVFFAMENEDAAGAMDDMLLRLEDIDAKFEEENRLLKQEETGNEDDDSRETDEKTENEDGGSSETDEKAENEDSGSSETDEKESDVGVASVEENNVGKDSVKEADTKEKSGEEADVIKDNAEETDAANAQAQQTTEEEGGTNQPAEQAFARSFAEYYRIEKGDTLCTISIKIYGDASKVKEICELNKITDPDCIKYGQKILLP
ncbi:MAG: LysM peptidoglycan-binding domain-containing protein [Blautia sp.]|nr:LysM peptidoglycan-binding domain-containing protein [Lachnoclostridium sp.]MCM1209974.1 LysM peptidoglycan-binding domain-containing protein [Blautia sp.]